MVKFGVELVPDKKILEIVEYSKIAEKNDFDHIWVTDHFVNRDVFVTLTTIGVHTKKIIIGPGVLNPYTRNILVVASAIKSLYELFPHRIAFGIGVGDKSNLDTLKITRTNVLSTISESVTIVRDLFTNNKVETDGAVFGYKGVKLFKQNDISIPIYMGAQGPKMLQLAGKIAEGVLVNASHPIDMKFAVDQCANKKIDVAAYTSLSLSDDRDKAVKYAKPIVAFIAGGASASVLERHGINIEKAQLIHNHLSSAKFSAATELVDQKMVDAFSICGTKTDCIDRIEELIKAGTTQVVAGSPIGPHISDALNILGGEVLPLFKN